MRTAKLLQARTAAGRPAQNPAPSHHSSSAILDLPASRRYLASKMSARSSLPQLETHPKRSASTAPVATADSLPNSQPILRQYFDALFAAHGPQHWWPGRTPFEVIVGAILTQNTSWTNVEPAIENLRREKLLTPRAIETVPFPRLARLIRSSGYFRQKTKKLKAFVRFLRTEYGGSLGRMFRAATPALREQLLTIHGIGPETADSILLYAGQHPVFVVDAYARRILERHRLAEPKQTYESIRQLFEGSLSSGTTPRDVALYNEFHALIVHTGKHYCRVRNPRCNECALNHLLPERNPATQ
jgi:endonuclease III related protein